MSTSRRMLGSIRARLTYANVVASGALFVALGGASYAAVSLPERSVGTKQLRNDAVKQSKLAPGSVGSEQLRRRSVKAPKLADRSVKKRTLAPWVRGQLTRRAATGPQGPAGPAGARGPAGPAATAIRYSAQASTTPAPRPAVDVAGLRISASCDVSGGTTTLNLSPQAEEDGTLYETVTADSGTDPANSGPVDFTGNLQIAFPAGSSAVLGGPSATDGFTRIGADAIYVTATRTVSLQLFLLVQDDAGTDSGSCSMNGVAVPAG